MEFPNIITPDEYDKWRVAGKKTSEVREYARDIIKVGMNIEEFSAMVEEKVREVGGTLGFPVNISFNECAAHDTADVGDKRTFTENDIVKVDVGVSLDGYIGDTAFTVDFSGRHENLVRASKEALESAISIVREGVTLGEIGKVIYEKITSLGFTPVVNLSGHGLARYEIHTSPSVPNYDTGSDVKLKDGMIIAIEPFATDGKGKISEVGKALIFAKVSDRNVRSVYGRKVLSIIKKFNTLPFSIRDINIPSRWLGIRDLLKEGVIKDFPPLVEVGKGMVSQTEHTLLVKKDGCEILTK